MLRLRTGPAEEIAWVKENSGGMTHPVGLKRPNAYGLYDMFGNVAEWCEDTYFPSHDGAPADGSARKGGRRRLSHAPRGRMGSAGVLHSRCPARPL